MRILLKFADLLNFKRVGKRKVFTGFPPLVKTHPISLIIRAKMLPW